MSIDTKNEISAASDASSEAKRETLSVATANKILICVICVLLFYIIGMQVFDTVKIKAETEMSEFLVTEPESTTARSVFTVNINTDDPFELTRLDGIGDAKAKAIIEYRKENGDFISIEEIMNVSGIGEALFEKIKNNITVE